MKNPIPKTRFEEIIKDINDYILPYKWKDYRSKKDVEQLQILYENVMRKFFSKKAYETATLFYDFDDKKKYGTMLEYLMKCNIEGLKIVNGEIVYGKPSIRMKYGGEYYLVEYKTKKPRFVYKTLYGESIKVPSYEMANNKPIPIYYYVFVVCIKSTLTARWFKIPAKDIDKFVDISIEFPTVKKLYTAWKRNKNFDNIVKWLIKYNKSNNRKEYKNRIVNAYINYINDLNSKVLDIVLSMKNYADATSLQKDIVDLVNKISIFSPENTDYMNKLVSKSRNKITPLIELIQKKTNLDITVLETPREEIVEETEEETEEEVPEKETEEEVPEKETEEEKKEYLTRVESKLDELADIENDVKRLFIMRFEVSTAKEKREMIRLLENIKKPSESKYGDLYKDYLNDYIDMLGRADYSKLKEMKDFEEYY